MSSHVFHIVNLFIVLHWKQKRICRLAIALQTVRYSLATSHTVYTVPYQCGCVLSFCVNYVYVCFCANFFFRLLQIHLHHISVCTNNMNAHFVCNLSLGSIVFCSDYSFILWLFILNKDDIHSKQTDATSVHCKCKCVFKSK